MKHGYPLGYLQKGKVQNYAYPASSHSQANNTSTNGSTSADSLPGSSYGFTQEEFQSIRALLQQYKPNHASNSITISPLAMNSHTPTGIGKNSTLKILDIGATNHITIGIPNFSSYHTIVPISVSLPNGSHIDSSISANIIVTPTLTLYNVLYIPTFHVNLISVTKLTSNMNFHLTFSSNTCQIL